MRGSVLRVERVAGSEITIAENDVGAGLGLSLSLGQLGADGVSAGWALGNSFSLQAGLAQKSRVPLCPG